MTINKMTASFGKLDGDSLELHEGLNVIAAPNESGKSTWCAFIRAMLYGVDSAERAKGDYLPDKIRYAPWSGAPMMGTMELTVGERDICITRSTKLKTAPMREFSAVYSGTNVPVDGLNGQNAGETLTGVSKDVFRRSALIEQGAVAVTGSPELEKRIAAIVSTGEEGSSYTEADEQLRAWQRKRRFNRRGRLPELEEQMAETKRKLQYLEGAAQESEQLSAQLESKRRESEELQEAMIESRKNARKDALSNLNSVRSELNAAAEKHKAAEDDVNGCKAALGASVIGLRKPGEVGAEVKDDLEKCGQYAQASAKKPSFILALIALIVCAAAVALGVMQYGVLFYALAAAMLIAAVFCFVVYGKKCAARKDAIDKRLELLKKYGASDESGIKQAHESYKALCAAYIAAEARAAEASTILAAAKQRQEATETATLSELDFSSGTGEAVRLGRDHSAAQLACDELMIRISELRGRIDAMGDPVALRSKLENDGEQYEQILAEYEAIALAVDTLRAADADIQSRFSPELGKLAASYMSQVTAGRYESVLINRDFSAKTRSAGDTVARESAYLSAGTLDLMYLAVRLAVCSLALPDGARCPLILDDTLVNFDPERTEQAMTLLRRVAKDRQVILFTCREIE